MPDDDAVDIFSDMEAIEGLEKTNPGYLEKASTAHSPQQIRIELKSRHPTEIMGADARLTSHFRQPRALLALLSSSGHSWIKRTIVGTFAVLFSALYLLLCVREHPVLDTNSTCFSFKHVITRGIMLH